MSDNLECPHCGKGYKLKKWLENHISTKHSTTTDAFKVSNDDGKSEPGKSHHANFSN